MTGCQCLYTWRCLVARTARLIWNVRYPYVTLNQPLSQTFNAMGLFHFSALGQVVLTELACDDALELQRNATNIFFANKRKDPLAIERIILLLNCVCKKKRELLVTSKLTLHTI